MIKYEVFFAEPHMTSKPLPKNPSFCVPFKRNRVLSFFDTGERNVTRVYIHLKRRFCHKMGFGDLKSSTGVQALDAYLADKSYIEGFVA